MFCKYCGTPLEGEYCSKCKEGITLKKRSTDLDRIMSHPVYEKPPVKTFEEGMREGYQRGLKDGYNNGYSEGVRKSDSKKIASGSVAKAPKKPKKIILYLTMFVSAVVLCAVVFGQLGYKIGHDDGINTGSENAWKEAEIYYSTLLEEQYSQGLEDGKFLGYEQGVKDTKEPTVAEAMLPDNNGFQIENDDNEVDSLPVSDLNDPLSEVLFSRTVNSGTPQNPSDDVKLIQECLVEKGYLHDDTDGVYGKKTELAVKLFQDENGLPATGEVDAETYSLLFPFEQSSDLSPQVTISPISTENPEVSLNDEEIFENTLIVTPPSENEADGIDLAFIFRQKA